MTLVSLPSPILWPGTLGYMATTPNFFTGATLDAAGEYAAFAFCAREDMVVSHIGFRAGTATGSPTCTVGIETLDASGLPSGSAGFGSTNGTTATITSNSWVLTALGASATISRGQKFCVKIAYASGTSQIIQTTTGLSSVSTGASSPYQIINAGTPTKSSLQATNPAIALGSNSTTFYQVPGAIPVSAITAGTFNNTNSAKRGLRFTPPMNCRAVGIRWFNSNTTGDYNIVLYNDAGTELSSSSTAFDGDQNGAAATASIIDFFDSPVTLTANTTYRIAVEPTSATNVNVGTFTVPSTDYRSATPAKTMAHYTTFASGSWTDTATDQLPLMDLVIDQVDDGAGTGGVVGVIGG